MRISVECGGFTEAADACRTANQTAALLTESLAGKLAGLGGMAGNDATSTAFAESYDAAAREAIGSLADLTHAFIGLGRLLGASGAHHAEAEAAAAGRVVAYSGGGLTADAYVRVAPHPPPTSLGAQEPSFGAVDRWILDHVEGFVWPGADVALLREAAHAWTRAAGSVAVLTDHLGVAVTFLERQVSPEVPTALACLDDVRSMVTDTADELTALASACEEHAAAVEATHDRTRALLEEIGRMVVEGVAISAIVAGVTGGLGGTAAGAAAIERVRRQAPRFHALLTGLRASATAASSRLRTTRDTLVRLRERFDRFARIAVRDERGEMRLPGGWLGGRSPGWLRSHDVPPGHTLTSHVGKTVDDLAARCRQAGIRRASSFESEEEAERLVARVLQRHESELKEWIRTGGDSKLQLDMDFGRPTGISVDASGNTTITESVRVVLIPNGALENGWQVLTAFPK